jgi:hypothetical protein
MSPLHRLLISWILILALMILPAVIGFITMIWLLRKRRKARNENREPAKEVRRCHRCGYELTQLRVPRCPECGALLGFKKSAEELGIADEIDIS